MSRKLGAIQFAGLEALRSVFKADLLGKIAEKHKLKSLLKLLNGTEVISHPDLIAFIDKTVEPWGAMEVLTDWRRKEILDYLNESSEVVSGTNGDFKQVTQGRAFLFWNQDIDKFYRPKDFMLKDFTLPVFKSVEVNHKFENNINISDQLLTYNDAFSGTDWGLDEINTFQLCVDHKAFSKTLDAESLCETLFQDEALLNLDLDGLDRAKGYLLSAAGAREISDIIKRFIDEAKIIVSNKYPISFVWASQNLINKELSVIGKVVEELQENILNSNVALDELLITNAEHDTSIKGESDRLERLKGVQRNLEKLIQEETLLFDAEVAMTKASNKALTTARSASTDEIRQKIFALEADILAQHEDEYKLLEVTYIEAKTGLSDWESKEKVAAGQLAKLEKKIPDYLAQQYVDENLKLRVKIKNTVLSGLKEVCFSLNLSGKFFLTEPTSVNLLFKGTIIPEQTESLFFVKGSAFARAPIDLASFRNKYREGVVGIAPNLNGYKNTIHCSDVFTNLSGKTARFFEKMNGGAFDPKNWSIKAYGAKLGFEDALDKSTTGWRQRQTSQATIFKEEIPNLKNSAIADFNKYQQLSERLIDFSDTSDVVFLQTLLKQKGYGDVSADGAWGSRSNSALVDIAFKGGVKYLEPKDWTLQMQRLLLAP